MNARVGLRRLRLIVKALGSTAKVLSDMATADTRYTFPGQFLEAAALFTRRAREIEAANFTFKGIPDETRTEHRAYVSACIMQCAAALETEAHEICVYGPGSYLGSDRKDRAAQKVLSPVADIIDQQKTLRRYELILHFLQKPPLSKGSEPYQSAALMVRLRNALIHYKSFWGAEMSDDKLFAAVQALGHKTPSFTPESMNFFPHRCLNGDCASWAVSATIQFLDHIYKELNVPSRFETAGKDLSPPPWFRHPPHVTFARPFRAPRPGSGSWRRKKGPFRYPSGESLSLDRGRLMSDPGTAAAGGNHSVLF